MAGGSTANKLPLPAGNAGGHDRGSGCLPPRAAAVAMKTPATTAMTGLKTTRKCGGSVGVAATLAAAAAAWQ